MRKRWLMLLPAAALLACTAEPPAEREEMTQRQRDSALAASRVPGAPAVGRALDVADSAAARAARADSIR